MSRQHRWTGPTSPARNHHSPLLPSRSPAPLAIQCPDRTALIALRAGEWAVSSGQDKSVKAPEIYKKNKKINGGCYATACLLHILILPHEHDDGGWCPSAANHLVLFSRALPLLPRLLRLLIMACPVPCTLRYAPTQHRRLCVCVLPPATRRGPEPGCSGRNMPRAGSGAAEGAARARGPGSTRAGTRKIHANPTRRRAGWRSGGRCCAGRLPLRRPDALWSLSLSPPSQPSFPVPASSPSSWEPPAGCMTRPLALALRCAGTGAALRCAPAPATFARAR